MNDLEKNIEQVRRLNLIAICVCVPLSVLSVVLFILSLNRMMP